MTLSPTASLIIEAARRRSVSRQNPLLASLPEKFQDFYPRQVEAIQQITQAYEDGYKVVVLEGPPGTGKTLIAEAVRRLRNLKTAYLCSTKSLQEQFCGDFKYASLIKGRGNYPTELYPERFRSDGLSCADCTKTKASSACQWCQAVHTCPYERVKLRAVKADLVVANMAYFLAECNSTSRLSIRGREFVIADEADMLDDQLLKFASVKVSARAVKKYKLRVPKLTVEADWVDWVDDTLPKVQGVLQGLPVWSEDIDVVRERNYLENLVDKLVMLKEGLEGDKWIYSGTRDEIEFKPVWVDQVAGKYLWRHGGSWLLMSATIGNAEELVRGLGWEEDYKFVGMPSVFKAENRKVICKPAASMTYKNQLESRPEIARGLKGILERHPSDRLLVHTVSYQLTEYLLKVLSAEQRPRERPILSYQNAAGRDRALQRFLNSPSGVLLAPSMDRGIDLPDDACRVQVLVKVPYPNVGDKQINKRLYGSGKRGKQWYTMQTIRSIVQMCGRAVRSEGDWAVTYILDAQFVKFYAEYGHWFPGGKRGWWWEGLKWDY